MGQTILPRICNAVLRKTLKETHRFFATSNNTQIFLPASPLASGANLTQ